MTPKERKKIYGEVSLYALCVGVIAFVYPLPLSFFAKSKEVYYFLSCALYALALIVPAITGLFLNRGKMPSPERKKLKYPPAAAVIFLAFLLISAYINFFVIYPLGASGIFVNVFKTGKHSANSLVV